MKEKNDISIVEVRKIAKAAGYKAGMPISEFQIMQIISAGYSAGIKASATKEKNSVLHR